MNIDRNNNASNNSLKYNEYLEDVYHQAELDTESDSLEISDAILSAILSMPSPRKEMEMVAYLTFAKRKSDTKSLNEAPSLLESVHHKAA